MKTLYISSNIEHLNRTLAERIINELESALANGQQALNLALSGGRTPQGLLARLVDKHRDSKVWNHVQVYWVDERHVAFDHPDSNYGNLRSFIEALGIPLNQIHPMGSNPDTEAAALEYHNLVNAIAAQRLSSPLFDLTLLGIGPDGHMASLFPGTEHRNDTLYCKAAIQPESGQARISLTLPALNRSACCIFMASGESKAHIVSQVYNGEPDTDYPASLIEPPGPAIWYVDEGAAKRLPA